MTQITNIPDVILNHVTALLEAEDLLTFVYLTGNHALWRCASLYQGVTSVQATTVHSGCIWTGFYGAVPQFRHLKSLTIILPYQIDHVNFHNNAWTTLLPPTLEEIRFRFQHSLSCWLRPVNRETDDLFTRELLSVNGRTCPRLDKMFPRLVRLELDDDFIRPPKLVNSRFVRYLPPNITSLRLPSTVWTDSRPPSTQNSYVSFAYSSFSEVFASLASIDYMAVIRQITQECMDTIALNKLVEPLLNITELHFRTIQADEALSLLRRLSNVTSLAFRITKGREHLLRLQKLGLDQCLPMPPHLTALEVVLQDTGDDFLLLALLQGIRDHHSLRSLKGHLASARKTDVAVRNLPELPPTLTELSLTQAGVSSVYNLFLPPSLTYLQLNIHQSDRSVFVSQLSALRSLKCLKLQKNCPLKSLLPHLQQFSFPASLTHLSTDSLFSFDEFMLLPNTIRVLEQTSIFIENESDLLKLFPVLLPIIWTRRGVLERIRALSLPSLDINSATIEVNTTPGTFNAIIKHWSRVTALESFERNPIAKELCDINAFYETSPLSTSASLLHTLHFPAMPRDPQRIRWPQTLTKLEVSASWECSIMMVDNVYAKCALPESIQTLKTDSLAMYWNEASDHVFFPPLPSQLTSLQCVLPKSKHLLSAIRGLPDTLVKLDLKDPSRLLFSTPSADPFVPSRDSAPKIWLPNLQQLKFDGAPINIRHIIERANVLLKVSGHVRVYSNIWNDSSFGQSWLTQRFDLSDLRHACFRLLPGHLYTWDYTALFFEVEWSETLLNCIAANTSITELYFSFDCLQLASIFNDVYHSEADLLLLTLKHFPSTFTTFATPETCPWDANHFLMASKRLPQTLESLTLHSGCAIEAAAKGKYSSQTREQYLASHVMPAELTNIVPKHFFSLLPSSLTSLNLTLRSEGYQHRLYASDTIFPHFGREMAQALPQMIRSFSLAQANVSLDALSNLPPSLLYLSLPIITSLSSGEVAPHLPKQLQIIRALFASLDWVPVLRAAIPSLEYIVGPNDCMLLEPSAP